MFNRIQKIGAINGDNNLIINGDVVANGEILPTVAAYLLRQDLEMLSREARAQVQADVKEYVQKVLAQVVECKLEDKLTELAHPGMQWAFHSALKGYTQSETEEQRDMLVDAMIDRLQENWQSPARMIIDSAIEILPHLTPTALSTLGLLQLRHQIMITPMGMMLDHFFACLKPLVEQMAVIDTLEADYMKQEKLILPILRNKAAPLEQFLLTKYDLFFRKSLPFSEFEDYCKEYPEAHEAVTDMGTCMMWVKGMDNSEAAFCCPNSNLLKNQLLERHQAYIIPHVDTLMRRMPPFTEQEVRDYFIKITPAWEKVFKLFSSEVIVNYTLSITGNYIGSKILAKACKGEPLPLSSYKRELL